MVQKFQIRQLIATRHLGRDNQATARCHTLAVFDISAITGTGVLTSYKFTVLTLWRVMLIDIASPGLNVKGVAS